MNLSIGIVGLPNVGKSTLFNALLKKQAALAANYPFATIEPNVGVVPVPDKRLYNLAEIIKTEKNMDKLPPVVPATVDFVDIAGLVKGASEGAGLGNKFLAHIREVRIIAHVVRAFEDSNIIREGSMDPESDFETIKTELMLADLQTLEKAGNDKNLRTNPAKKSAIDKIMAVLNEDKAAYEASLTEEEQEAARELFLLTSKPAMVVLNVAEDDYNDESIEKILEKYSSLLGIVRERCVVVCAKVEEELAELDENDQKEYLSGLGVNQSGLEILIQKAYATLGLISYFTAGEKEVRAWTIKDGSTAPIAAGTIHTDFQKNFIAAEVVAYNDFAEFKGWAGVKDAGKLRLEGRDYIVKDGDVMVFKHN